MIVLVTGGRDYVNRERVYSVLDEINGGVEVRSNKIHLLVVGGAPGADQLAFEWAVERGVHTAVYRANWTKFGKSAGARRNEAMVCFSRPNLVVAFPGGKGTADCVRCAGRHGVQIKSVTA